MYLDHTIRTIGDETTLTVDAVFDNDGDGAERRMLDQLFGMRALIRAPAHIVLFADLLAPDGATFRVRGGAQGEQADALRNLLNIACREIVDEFCCLQRLRTKPSASRRSANAAGARDHAHAAF